MDTDDRDARLGDATTWPPDNENRKTERSRSDRLAPILVGQRLASGVKTKGQTCGRSLHGHGASMRFGDGPVAHQLPVRWRSGCDHLHRVDLVTGRHEATGRDNDLLQIVRVLVHRVRGDSIPVDHVLIARRLAAPQYQDGDTGIPGVTAVARCACNWSPDGRRGRREDRQIAVRGA